MNFMERPEAIQRLRQRAAFEAIRDGSIRVPLARCGWCRSDSVISSRDEEGFKCLSCGRMTDLTMARTLRRQRITAILTSGIDVPLGGRG